MDEWDIVFQLVLTLRCLGLSLGLANCLLLVGLVVLLSLRGAEYVWVGGVLVLLGIESDKNKTHTKKVNLLFP